jgi:hypothetical protein
MGLPLKEVNQIDFGLKVFGRPRPKSYSTYHTAILAFSKGDRTLPMKSLGLFQIRGFASSTSTVFILAIAPALLIAVSYF